LPDRSRNQWEHEYFSEEKKRIIADMNASCLADTQSQWVNIADTIQAAMIKLTIKMLFFNLLLILGRYG